jgi:hypothetical protein
MTTVEDRNIDATLGLSPEVLNPRSRHLHVSPWETIADLRKRRTLPSLGVRSLHTSAGICRRNARFPRGSVLARGEAPEKNIMRSSSIVLALAFGIVGCAAESGLPEDNAGSGASAGS